MALDQAWQIKECAVLRGQAGKGREVPCKLAVEKRAISKAHRNTTWCARRSSFAQWTESNAALKVALGRMIDPALSGSETK